MARDAEKPSWSGDVAEGWRLARPALNQALTAGRRRVLLISASALGVGLTALLHPIFERILGEPSATMWSLAAGLTAALIDAWILMFRWRLPGARADRFVGAVAPAGDGVEKEIRRAHAEGREPNVPVAARLSAADKAERYRRTASRGIAGVLPAAGFIVPLTMIIVTDLPRFAFSAAVFGVANGLFTPLTLLATLGRTTAAIATRPATPDHLESNGTKKTRPSRSLGTDHPMDYT